MPKPGGRVTRGAGLSRFPGIASPAVNFPIHDATTPWTRRIDGPPRPFIDGGAPELAVWAEDQSRARRARRGLGPVLLLPLPGLPHRWGVGWAACGSHHTLPRSKTRAAGRN